MSLLVILRFLDCAGNCLVAVVASRSPGKYLDGMLFKAVDLMYGWEVEFVVFGLVKVEFVVVEFREGL